ncbi:MAG: hypothetical protein A4E52_00036 [Pelotomaculum sp. PtaB.Bin013]|uniref:UPF0178 protein L7E55_17305 n=1 Tax=Pelotomaculum isophthalicicum JI TaxID=947010 RepID=A0A9X4QAG7_9FIRM|nr:DUF188 domain-containing protein [Pelotomaculum isophthalicicum]MDF9410070.1 DUF188 domain-containing protein [Pelotomaculum isophthalicicum JI]OPX92270.1 MAG: hypothetical protein A4E52_00036 [Pelotomaculum sp. PtaB.Bin013]
MRIIIDADATPKSVLEICRQAAAQLSLPMITVANFNHKIDSENHIVVGNAPQEADMEIMKLAVKGDIVITQDWGLAAMTLGKGAAALSPSGRIFSPDTIDFLLEERELKAKHRRSGGRTKGPAKRTSDDDKNFTKSLYMLLKDHKT